MRVFGITVSWPPWTARVGRPRGAPRMAQRGRRIAAAAVLGCAVAVLAWILVPESDAGTSVVVAARTVPAGQKITDADLRIASFPRKLAPADSIASPDVLIGHTAAHQLSAGIPLTRDTVMSPDTARLARGHVLVPVSIPDAAASAVLQPGHRVRVYAAGEQTDTDTKLPDGLASDSRTLVPEAVVTAVRRPESGGLAGETATVVTLSVPENRAGPLAAVAPGGLGFALLN